MREKKRLKEISGCTRIKQLLLLLFFIFITSIVNAQKRSGFTDSIFRDIHHNPFLKKKYYNGILQRQYWILNGKSISVEIVPTIEANVFGDLNKLHSFLRKNLEWPQKDIQGNVLLAVFVDKNGNIRDERVLKKIPGCDECNDAAIKTLKLLPKFEPAKFRSRSVNGIKYLFVKFNVQ